MVVVRPGPGTAIVECRGEHDVATRQEVADLLAELVAENELIVVDLTEAQFIDSSFLHNLVTADHLARGRGVRLRIQTGPSPLVRRALETSNILSSLEHASTRAEVLAEVKRRD